MLKLLLCLALLTQNILGTQLKTSDLRCEGLSKPLGIDNTNPHFSWKVISDCPTEQEAYEIQVASDSIMLTRGKADLWQSHMVSSRQSVMVPYRGKTLSSRQLVYWRVRIKDARQTSDWSPIQRFSVGVIDGDTLRGNYIGLPIGEDKAVLLQRSFNIKKTGKTTLLHVNSLGYHEVYINGRRLSEAVLTPAVSQLDRRSLIVTYDVTPFLKRGQNTLTLWISSGWYKKSTFHAAFDGALVRAEMDMLDHGTWRPLIQTDASWKGCESGCYDLGSWESWDFIGEKIDARILPCDMSDGSLKNMKWQPVMTAQLDGIIATPQMCQNTIVKETIIPQSIRKVGNDKWLLDFGRVMNGQFEIHLPYLDAGHEVKVSFCDHLKDNGEMDDIDCEDHYISSGNPAGDTFRERFNHQCYRYVTLSNLPVTPDIQSIKALRIGMDTEATATFTCSDEDMNAIHQMLSYTMDNLTYCGYMVDCAHIEQLGYGGDGNASTLSLQNEYNVAPVYMNWLQAWSDVQQPDGGLPHTAPCPYHAGGGPYWCSFPIQAAWRTWQNYGDDRLLLLYYSNMKRWLQYVDTYSHDGLLHKWPDTDYRNWYLGDWLAPQGVDVMNEASIDLVNNCALSQSYNELIQIADYLKKYSDKEDFVKRRSELNQNIHNTFYHADSHSYATGSQLDMIYPMLVGATPPELLPEVQQTLMQSRDHLGVGLVGIPVLAEWATHAHQADYVYQMLKKEDYPGYLYMLRNGATTTWEDWNKPRSYMHNCFNGMASWFIQALGGILPASPGYQETLIAPQFPDGMDWARVTRETPYGTILVSWERRSDTIAVHVEIPNGILATVNGSVVTSGSYDYKCK